MDFKIDKHADKFRILFTHVYKKTIDQTISVKMFLKLTDVVINLKGSEWVMQEIGELFYRQREIFATNDITTIANHFIDSDWKRQRDTWGSKFKIPVKIQNYMLEQIKIAITQIRDTHNEKLALMFQKLFQMFMQYLEHIYDDPNYIDYLNILGIDTDHLL